MGVATALLCPDVSLPLTPVSPGLELRLILQNYASSCGPSSTPLRY